MSGSPANAGVAEWEAAYLRFETPAEARAKIRRRLLRFGSQRWHPDAAILEIFCGSGYGLDVLTELGFRNLDGMDLSADLLGRYRGPARCHVGDCRELPFEPSSKSVVIVQGGLHHLERLDDVAVVLAEVHRVLTPHGVFCAVEPWRTPFLRVVLAVAGNPVARRCWGKLDAFQTMVEHERDTYERWLDHADRIDAEFRRFFSPRVFRTRWGALTFVGEPRGPVSAGERAA